MHLDEPRPEREVRSKNFIPKVMFLAAVTQPRFDEHMETAYLMVRSVYFPSHTLSQPRERAGTGIEVRYASKESLLIK